MESVVPESINQNSGSRADELHMNARRGMNHGAKRVQPVRTRTPHIAGRPS
jgi:hypothetical protein